METYEVTIIIKWHKNDNGSRRPITIDCYDEKELIERLKSIKNDFMTKGEDPDVAEIYKTQEYVGVPAYSVNFYITERK